MLLVPHLWNTPSRFSTVVAGMRGTMSKCEYLRKSFPELRGRIEGREYPFLQYRCSTLVSFLQLAGLVC
jgi:hypothetical protein